ncbi:MAG: hypothetical protein NTW75_17920 [Planctomycetales bacterium]|jgi:hypothetical protein|nr:hypothetical protein [Planctomycetales bacterium]
MALPQETRHDNSKRLGGSDLVRKDSPSLSKACSAAAIVVEQTESSGGDSYSPIRDLDETQERGGSRLGSLPVLVALTCHRGF